MWLLLSHAKPFLMNSFHLLFCKLAQRIVLRTILKRSRLLSLFWTITICFTSFYLHTIFILIVYHRDNNKMRCYINVDTNVNPDYSWLRRFLTFSFICHLTIIVVGVTNKMCNRRAWMRHNQVKRLCKCIYTHDDCVNDGHV